MTFTDLSRMIRAEDWEAIESARGPRVAPHVSGLVELYDALDSWAQKLAIIQLLQDQDDIAEVRRVMLDVLRAPNVHDWFQDTVELTKAAALGFIDEEYDTFMVFYNDRQRLAETVAQVLAANRLEQVASGPAPAPIAAARAESLLEAAGFGDLTAIRAFAAAGADLDAPGDFKHIKDVPPIIFALIEDQLEAVDVLIECGADPNVVRDGGQTALSWAVFKGHYDMTARLIALGGDVRQEDRYGATLVKCAAQYGYDEILDLLLKHGAPIDGALGDGRTAMWFAAETGKTAAVLRLVDAGCDINQIDSGSAPIHLASRNNSSRFLTALIKAGANVDLRNDDGDTPLMLAAKGGYASIVKKLLAAGADASLTNADGLTADQLATGKRADEVRAAFE